MKRTFRLASSILLVLSLACPSAWAGPGAGCGRGACEAKKAGKTMKIMTYNIRHGAGMDGRWDLRRIAEVVRKVAPDVACFQEVEVGSSRSFGADEPRMLAYFLEPGIRFSRFSKSIDFGGGEYGNAMVSAADPLSTKVLPLPGAEPRSFLLCEFEDCYVGTAHLALEAAAALESVPLIVEATRGLRKPVFITGDWNVEPGSPVIRAFEEHFAILTDPGACTWPADQPNQCIDYIAVDKAHAGRVEVRSAEVIAEPMASDHRPVVVSCALLP